ncbi:hypothetical protein DPMN_181653 [Dreissena polymorpha]|uniref:Secreted protein n=1 Tax=Dreissena polymorpha TaxID=45954 RepID=A0A9D4DEW9_DREPO|nr:hypothetical protein DPMN_181653 [Dreissena polymorpha]
MQRKHLTLLTSTTLLPAFFHIDCAELWSKVLMQSRRERFTSHQVFDTVRYEQPTQHEPLPLYLPPQSSLAVQESLHYQTFIAGRSPFANTT